MHDKLGINGSNSSKTTPTMMIRPAPLIRWDAKSQVCRQFCNRIGKIAMKAMKRPQID